MSNEQIGCSLADAAATPTYMEYLSAASSSTFLERGFSLAMEARRRGMGVQDLYLDRNINDHLQFVLGIDSGMVTSIVATVRKLVGACEVLFFPST
ncbi:hypothetical protein VNO80_21605 [Phaseolus coccineus]|uniref:Uncharacterized protein n=1 Tax=Phaseolus coccineus TaxID=3886 RepID=A0AAN9M8D6_PHACN